MYNLKIKPIKDPILPVKVDIMVPYAIIWGFLDVKKKVWRYFSNVYDYNILETLSNGPHRNYRWDCPITVYDEED